MLCGSGYSLEGWVRRGPPARVAQGGLAGIDYGMLEFVPMTRLRFQTLSVEPIMDYSTRSTLRQCLGTVLHIGVAFSKRFIIAVKQDLTIYKSIRGLHCTWLVPRYEGLFRWRRRFILGRVDLLEEGRSTVEGVAQSVYVDTASCSAVGRTPCGGEPRGA
ncbi:hypothetical protein M9H77_31490 [Catharanthus roseus]|uniref:Uncharacterized protein n=1 Tax=Catharanthus roseus TaxID=4058 RepID=A0ACC0A2L0_CATRO|nr:hypothetical protein M9H77_31490 [Catharanthus roseus]